jgi:hypothetical protein
MDSDGEEPPSKRRHYERSSTPIRELDPLQPPELPPLKEAEEGRENGLHDHDIVEDPIQPIGPAPERDTEPGLDDTVILDEDDGDNDQGPDYFGLSDEAMGKNKLCFIPVIIRNLIFGLAADVCVFT